MEKVIFVKKVFPMFSVLSSRESGLFLRKIVERELLKNDVVVLDLDGIEMLTHGFADELIGVIVKNQGLDFVKNRIKVRNARDGIRTHLNWVVSIRKEMLAKSG